MKAWRAHRFGPPEVLQFDDVPDAPLAAGQARVEVRAAAVNFPDALLVAGSYQLRPEPPFIPGMEAAGVVVESQSPKLAVGARVAVLTPSVGCYATHVVVPPVAAFVVPDAVPFDDAAAMTVTYQTGWFGLHRRAALRAGETLLVHAAAGGVGSAAVQLGKAAGARVLATAGGPAKVAQALALGADAACDYTGADFVDFVKRETGGRGADVIYDPVGGEVFERSTKCVAFEGRIVVVGFTSGQIPSLRTNHVLLKNYAVLGLHWGAYGFRDPASIEACQAELYRLHVAGALRPLVSERVPLAEAPAALARVAGRQSTGKIILLP
jgi:NADPH2:quinone reductase